MGIDLYPTMIHEGNIAPDSFEPEIDALCEEIHEACKGFGTDENRLLQAMGTQTMETRCFVHRRYKELFGKELKDVMTSECGHKPFGTALALLSLNPLEAECEIIEMAAKGLGTNELLLMSVVCGRTNKEMEILKKEFYDLKSLDLGQVLAVELKGDLEKLLFNVLQAAEEEYDWDIYTEDRMAEDAEKLYEMGQGQFGTNESGLFKLICSSPPEYLKKLNLVYAEKYGYSIDKMFDNEIHGITGKAAVYNLGMKMKPYETVADLIHQACKRFGTNELLLTTVLIRFQLVLKDVQEAYVEKYGTTIQDTVHSETGGVYEKLLVSVVETAAA